MPTRRERMNSSSTVGSGPSTPVDAGSMVIWRPGDNGPEYLLTERPQSMAFGPGAHVFPGGSVEAGDWGIQTTDRLPTDTPDVNTNTHFGATLHAILIAAVREVFEEVGLLLLKGDKDSLSTVRDELIKARTCPNLSGGDRLFNKCLREAGVEVAWNDFEIISRWVSPEWFPRRFDTVFFLAKMPENQRVEIDRREVEGTLWLTGDEALYRWSVGNLPMMTATTCVLAALHGAPFARESHLHGTDPLTPIMFQRHEVEGRTRTGYQSECGFFERDAVLAHLRSLARDLDERPRSLTDQPDRTWKAKSGLGMDHHTLNLETP